MRCRFWGDADEIVRSTRVTPADRQVDAERYLLAREFAERRAFEMAEIAAGTRASS
jgi:hypothetical protein